MISRRSMALDLRRMADGSPLFVINPDMQEVVSKRLGVCQSDAPSSLSPVVTRKRLERETESRSRVAVSVRTGGALRPSLPIDVVGATQPSPRDQCSAEATSKAQERREDPR